MPGHPFSRSLRSLHADDARPQIAGILLAASLAAAGVAWLFLARVTRYETSEAARLEAAQAAHRVEAPASGKVAAVKLALGAEVQAGELLVELDDGALRLEMEEKRARLATATAQAAPLRSEIASREQALRDTQEEGLSEVGEAKARARGAAAVATYQETEAQRVARLREGGVLSASDAGRLAADAQAKRAAAEAEALGARRADASQRGRGSVLRAEIARLGREAAALDGEALALRSAIDALAAAIERRRIRAPVAGTVGEIAAIAPGSVVREGDLVAAIVPRGELRVVAQVAPAAVGRLRPGQPGRVRLDAFPWTEYGAVRATVASVSTEAQNGLLRVELRVHPDGAETIPLQHGLAGTVIIEVERVSPATLILRAAGQLARTAPAEGG
ncbi:HlyD family secretion protein [Sorangium sp. So ce1000]|uniref:HlyD family secretion protein n=1 Tax=Sorangium sp. So ce1000 TaxID=3133325 RepID=UPI003F6336BC